jgi:hypothetical protein
MRRSLHRAGRAALVALVALVALGAGAAAAAADVPGPTLSEPAEPAAPSVPPDPALASAARIGRITVHAAPGLERAARRLAESAETALARIASDLADLPVPRAIEVRVVDDASQLAAVAPAGRDAPPWAVGVAYPDLGVISVALRRGPDPLDAAATLRHELAHVALGAALGPRVPRWLHEGFAYQHSAEWSWDRMEALAGMSWLGGIIPFQELDRSFPREELPAHRAYAESYDFVGYLSRRGRYEDRADDGDRWPFRRFLAGIAGGATVDDAARQAFGRPIGELFDEWRSDLGKRYLLMPIGLLGLAVWIVIALLLVLAWRRRRKQNRIRLAQWAAEDRARAAVIAPPYVAWPGRDPFAEPEAEAEPERPPPELLN